MPNPSQSTKDLEREAAKYPPSDQLHQSDQSLHQQEIMKEREAGQKKQKDGQMNRERK